MEQVAFVVPAVNGRDAERAATTALVSVDGVEWATAAGDGGVVAAGYDPRRATETDLRDALAATGYEVPAPDETTRTDAADPAGDR